MKTSLISLAIGLILCSFLLVQEHEIKWQSDFEQSIKEAKSRNVPILMRFQGSDWCGNCWRLDSTLFETTEFREYAPKEFVLLALDFPMKPENKLPEKQTIHNKKLRDKYLTSREGFPAVFILNSNGEVLGKMSVAPSLTKEYINQLKKIVRKTNTED